jgi:hypothetical protein
MTQPRQNGLYIGCFGYIWPQRPIYHNDPQPQRTRRVDLGDGTAAPCVLCDYMGDPVVFHQRDVTAYVKGPSRDRYVVLRQGDCRLRFIDKPQQIAVLGSRGELVDMHSANRQKDARCRFGQSSTGAGDVGHMGPMIARLRAPRRSRQPYQGHASSAARLVRVLPHCVGEGVGGIDHVADPFILEIGRQTIDATKAAYTHRNRLRNRRICTAGVRKNSLYLGGMEGLRQLAGLCGSAQQKDAHHG